MTLAVLMGTVSQKGVTGGDTVPYFFTLPILEFSDYPELRFKLLMEQLHPCRMLFPVSAFLLRTG